MAVTDSVTTDEDTPISISPLANDTDVEGDALALTGYTQPGNGTLAENQDGTLTYTPAANFNGSDSFDYTIADSTGGTATGTVNIAVSPVNDVPVVSNIGNLTVNQDTGTGTIAFTISDPDNDVGNLTVTATSSNPSLAGDESISLGGSGTDRTVTVTPTAGQFGTATIALSVSDGTDTVTETFDVTVNGLPVANDDTLGSVFLSSPLQIAVADLTANDTDPEGGALTVQAVSDAVNGSVSLEGGVITFRGQTDFSGTASFDYTVDDGNGGTDTATVTLTVASVVELSEIAAGSGVPAGTGGFAISGEAEGDSAGGAVSAAGDLNSDGFADLLVGARLADASGADSGKSYVVFGKPDFEAVSLSEVAAGTGGFAINGEAAGDWSGHAVSDGGDISGDGIADLIVGAPNADSNGDNAGKIYAVFGKADSTPVNLSDVTSGTGGFVMIGETAGDGAGMSVNTVGDVNGDGIADVIVSAIGADPNGSNSGKSYVVFGKGNGAAVNLSDVAAGTGGFAINGEAAGDNSGTSADAAGDVNGDGLADVIVGSPGADATGGADSGKAYVVFGKADGTPVSLSDVASGTGGFAINGENAGNRTGVSVSGGGDINGDGIADLIVGARAADPNGSNSGRTYVVFGKTDTQPVDLSDVAAGTGGFVIDGESPEDYSGRPVRMAGDVNGDGLDDVLLGVSEDDPVGANSGRSYVVFGKADGAALNLSDVASGIGGFAINGESPDDRAGTGLKPAGDVNGDGFADLIVGANQAEGNGSDSGKAYVVFGGDFTGAVTGNGGAGDDTLTGTADSDALVGGAGNDTLTGSGGADVLYGGAGDDILAVSDLNFRRIRGGGGTDTLRLDGSGLSLDLTAISDQGIAGIERIDLTGSASNSLTLGLSDAIALSAPGNQLVVEGAAGNQVSFAGQGWTLAGTATLDGNTYTEYTLGGAAVLVDTDITATL